MTTKVIVKFLPTNSKETRERFTATVLTTAETDTMGSVFRGIVFEIERSPLELLADMEQEGFEFEDFKAIEFMAY